jgi:hypothetical protein
MKNTLNLLSASSEEIRGEFAKLTVSNEEFKAELAKLRTTIGEDLKATKDLLTTTTEEMEKKIKLIITEKYDEALTTCTTRNTENIDSIQQIKTQALIDASEVAILKTTLSSQQDTITSLETSLDESTARYEALAKKLDEYIQQSEDKFTQCQEGIYANRKMTNEVEAHARRWAIRIMGMPAPEGQESTNDAKKLVLHFIANSLKVSNVLIGEIDCAHRVGKISSDKKQTMLVRFFKRDLTDHLLRKKKILKNSGFVVFEDTTWVNRRLINALNNRAEVEKAWCIGGSVWVKLKNNDKKLKVGINDNLDEIVSPPLTPSMDTTPDPQTTAQDGIHDSLPHNGLDTSLTATNSQPS